MSLTWISTTAKRNALGTTTTICTKTERGMLMRISTKDIREGDLVRLSDGTRGEVVRVNRMPASAFRWAIYLKDDMGRVGPRFVNAAGSVETIDTIKHSCPFC